MPTIWHFECGDCDKVFPSGFRARENHCRSTGHGRPAYECDGCPRFFGSHRALYQHMNDCNHFAYDCSQCNETYPDAGGVKDHEITYHHYCAECDRHFNNYNNIKMVSSKGKPS